MVFPKGNGTGFRQEMTPLGFWLISSASASAILSVSLIVTPSLSVPITLVTTHTPVGNCPYACLNALTSKTGSISGPSMSTEFIRLLILL